MSAGALTPLHLEREMQKRKGRREREWEMERKIGRKSFRVHHFGFGWASPN
jgi:hypothetical protein